MKIRKLAAIDIGSNAMRLLIKYVYEVPDKEPVFNKTSLARMPVRLGEDVFIRKKISKKNINRMIDAMTAYKLMMKTYKVEKYLAYATSAMREAENGKEVIQRIKDETGIKIKIISGDEEAELVYETELQRFIEDENYYLFVDVGGGSTELTLLTNQGVSISKSFPIGTVRLLNEKVGKDVYQNMKDWVTDNIRQYDVEIIGSGGNINHVFKYSGVKIGRPLQAAYLRKKYREIREMSYEDRLMEFNMKTDRADVIEYALDIYIKVIKWSRAKKVHVPKIGISDGMILNLYDKVKQ